MRNVGGKKERRFTGGSGGELWLLWLSPDRNCKSVMMVVVVVEVTTTATTASTLTTNAAATRIAPMSITVPLAIHDTGSECLGVELTSKHHTSHVTRHTSHVTRHTSHVTRHTSHVTRHTSHVTRHTSHVTRHTSHVKRHTSNITCLIEIWGSIFPNTLKNKQNMSFKNVMLMHDVFR